ncbi:glycoside hydrolase family 3 protein [Draconibacterium halophilum]|uniref:beta-glucosidase n=1 Tax=Draconibacterium halophilum TaxID=2706887 RepID=A0A6C0R866_9BACT|nr:glycoside hydrolase family 3 N-terminal domain-containing protein [Draconibacterium halophilum]QIA06568.1 glycoside hydrolase family 3 protein [Draconibacterium halophilum]
MKTCTKTTFTKILIFVVPFLLFGCGAKWSEEQKEGFNLVYNEGGLTLGYSPSSGVSIIENKGFAFKDLNKNGELDKYEDWRLTFDERAQNLASQMSVEQIAGLMLYSAHQSIPGRSGGRRGFGGATYNGKSLAESGAESSDLYDQQIKFLTEDNLRHVLITSVESPAVAAKWNNNMQALVESIGLGIPGNNSSDPRHRTSADAEFNEGAGGQISMWPTSLGMAATFNPELVENFGDIAATEYRALGIATALSPQIDLATEPRWGRFSGTFGEDPQLDRDMARAYVDGFQTSEGDAEIEGGWGYNSVNAMVKHWPSGGPEEGGRDAHFSYGKYAVYPGNNFDEHLIPFTEGAFKLDGATGMASAVMPYYTISFGIDQGNGENVGNSYNNYIIQDLLRDKYGYDGVLCTDWGVTKDYNNITSFGTTPWGAEKLTVAERHYKIIMAGVDQFGGNNDMGPVIEAYNMGVEEHGEEFMRNRFEKSAVRLLRNIFHTGLFENPYLDSAETERTVGNAEFMAAGYQAQLKSVVMLKNAQNSLPIQPEAKVYVPKKYYPASQGMFGFGGSEARWDYPVSLDIVNKYASVTETATDADYALLFINSPNGGSGYSTDDVEAGGNGYVPISLQYSEYTATHAREVSIAGGDPLEDFTNRSYKGKTTTATNTADLDLVLETKKAMGDKPVIVVVNVSNPMVFAEFEKAADAIVVSFGVQDQAIMDILSGKAEPSGLLPMQMPANMKTIEEQFEDVPHDMECYVDAQGNTYDFAFGLNWSGVINDERVSKYK